MTKYYIDESGLLTGKVPPGINRPPTLVRRGQASYKPLKKCPVCGQQIGRLTKHIRKVHPDYIDSHTIQESTVLTKKSVPAIGMPQQGPNRLMTQCPHCKSPVRNDRLEKHILNACPAQKISTPSVGKLDTRRAKPDAEQEGISDTDSATRKVDIEEEALRQSFDEPIDGGKYLGHMRREWDGKFGSLPLYDDYEDESNAD